LAEIAVDSPEVVRGIQRGLIQAVLDANAPEYRVSVFPDAGEGSCLVNLVVRMN